MICFFVVHEVGLNNLSLIYAFIGEEWILPLYPNIFRIQRLCLDLIRIQIANALFDVWLGSEVKQFLLNVIQMIRTEFYTLIYRFKEIPR